jgi:two-component system, NarL family, response regulator
MFQLTTKPIRILIVDDHPVVRAGLTSMLGTQTGIEVIASASSGEAALTMIGAKEPDIVLLDLRMPGLSGVETILEMKRARYSARIIILTGFETDEDLYRAVQAGAQGYPLKETSLKEMVQAIKTVQSAKRYLPRDIAARLAERMMRANLTSRELEILKMLSKGLTNNRLDTPSASATIRPKITLTALLKSWSYPTAPKSLLRRSREGSSQWKIERRAHRK